MGRTEEVELKNYTEEILQKYMKKFDLTDDHLLHKLEDTIQELTIKLQYYEQNWWMISLIMNIIMIGW